MTTGGQSVTLTASSTAALGASTVIFKGSSGGLNSSSQATITVTQGAPGLPNNRTSFVRTDDTPMAVVYEQVHKLSFPSVMDLDCVDVSPVTTQQVVNCILISG